MHARHFILLVNPRSGTRRGLVVLDQVQTHFAAAGVALHVLCSEYPGHATELARTLDLSGCDGVCLIGGDGTLHEVANGLLQRGEAEDVPLGIIPGGTGNSVLQHLGLSTPEQAVECILAGITQPADVARVTWPDRTVYCLNIVGWGSAVDINRTAERWRLLGPPRYALGALWHILRARRRRARLVLDGEVIEDEFMMVLGCNTKYTGKGMLAAPRADVADGKIDVLVVRNASRRQMLRLFQGVFDGSHITLPCVEYYQVQSFRLEPEAEDLVNLDGELKYHAPISVEVCPGAVQIFQTASRCS